MLQKEIEKNLDKKLQSQVLVLQVDALFKYFDTEVAKEATTETRFKGFRVKVEYDALSDDEMKKKRESVTKFVVDSARKNKKKDKE
jgi:hypothetical protein